jgi:hypothetical protein
MSKPPEKQLPAHLRPLTLDIPATWTPEEVLAVFELIDDLRARSALSITANCRRCFSSNGETAMSTKTAMPSMNDRSEQRER